MRIKNLALASVAIISMMTSASSACAASTEFATIGKFDFYNGSAGYSNGGVNIKYVSLNNGGSIWTYSQPTAPSGFSWYTDGDGDGYSDISLSNGKFINSAKLLVGSGYISSSPNFLYQLMNGSSIVASGNLGNIPAFSGFSSLTITSATAFDHLFVKANFDNNFIPAAFEALAIGKIDLTEVAAVPEPATWVMMLAGFGMIGFAARKRSSVKTTVAYA